MQVMRFQGTSQNKKQENLTKQSFGCLTQLVQSASLTRMKSGVRVPQCPQDKYILFSLNVMTKHIDPCLSLMQTFERKGQVR